MDTTPGATVYDVRVGANLSTIPAGMTFVLDVGRVVDWPTVAVRNANGGWDLYRHALDWHDSPAAAVAAKRAELLARHAAELAALDAILTPEPDAPVVTL